MEGNFSVSTSEKSMASSTTMTTTTTVSSEDSERRDSNCYFPDCRKDANCNCEICLDSLNAMLDLMPLSVQKSSLTKLSYASNNKLTVESTPTSFDPAIVTTPASVSRPISRVVKKKKVKESIVSEQRKTMKKNKSKPLLGSVFIVVLVIWVVLCWELGFLKPEFTEEVVRKSVQRSKVDSNLGEKLRVLEDELKGFARNGKFSSCIDSNSKWKINQGGPMLNSKCVLYKSVIEEVSIWGWPLQTAGLYHTEFFSSSITVLSGRVTEWTEGKFGYTKHNTSTSWKITKLSTSLQQLDPNTWVLEYTRSSVIDESNLLSLTMDFLKHMMFQVVKNANWKPYWIFSASKSLYREADTKARTMTPT